MQLTSCSRVSSKRYAQRSPRSTTRSSVVLSRHRRNLLSFSNLRFAIVSSGSPSCHHHVSRTVGRPGSFGLPASSRWGTFLVPAISPLRTALRSLSRSWLFAPGRKSLSLTCFRLHPFWMHRSAEKCHGWSYRKSPAELVAGVGAGGGGTEAVLGLGTDGSGLACDG